MRSKTRNVSKARDHQVKPDGGYLLPEIGAAVYRHINERSQYGVNQTQQQRSGIAMNTAEKLCSRNPTVLPASEKPLLHK